MSIKVIVTDLQTHIFYRGTLRNSIVQGQPVEVGLENKPNHSLRIGSVRGWLGSTDSPDTFYLFDTKGKRFKVQVKASKVIDSKP